MAPTREEWAAAWGEASYVASYMRFYSAPTAIANLLGWRTR